MTRRVALLLVLLAIAAAAAGWWHSRRAGAPPPDAVPSAVAPAKSAAHARIDDATGILEPFGPRLGRMADAMHDDLGIDVHVVTLAEPGRIEVQSARVFQERRIGANAATGGLLLLLNPETRQARIEVGYSLEGGFTDLHMGRIARDQLAPYVSYSSAGMAVMDVLHYLRDHAYLAAVRGEILLGDEYRRRESFAQYQRYFSGGAGARTRLPAMPSDTDVKRRIPERERARYAPSADPEESVAAFLRATADLAGDPSLPLFTEGSRLMRARYPLAPFEEERRLQRIEESRPLVYRIEGDRAVVTSERPAAGFVPILLHREGGLWRVDQVETWKNLFFDADGDYFLRNANTPYRFGLAEFGDGRWHDIGALPTGDGGIAGELDALRSAGGVLARLREGELWFRNAFAFPPALAAYDAAVRAAPKDPLVLETLAERALYLGFPELAIPALEQAGPGFEAKLAEAWHDAGDGRLAGAWIDKALAEDPYDLHALNWKEFLAERYGSGQDQELARAQLLLVLSGPKKLGNPVWLQFDPQRPRFHPEGTLRSGDTAVHDHSRFAVTMTNRSGRPVVIDRVRLASRGTAAASGLGDVKDYWTYPSGGRRLAPGESVRFDKLWGFTVDTGHEHVRYVFETCWHGLGEAVRQCRTQWVDVLP